jgi:hypothetical protein
MTGHETAHVLDFRLVFAIPAEAFAPLYISIGFISGNSFSASPVPTKPWLKNGGPSAAPFIDQFHTGRQVFTAIQVTLGPRFQRGTHGGVPDASEVQRTISRSRTIDVVLLEITHITGTREGS